MVNISRDKLCEIASFLADVAFNTVVAQEDRKDNYKKDSEHWSFIPSSAFSVVDMLLLLKKEGKKNFLDIGCGIPWIPKMASLIGIEKSKGIDFNTGYSRFGSVVGDAKTYSLSGYDCIYMYQILKQDKFFPLVKNIVERASPGCRIIVRITGQESLFTDYGFKPFNGEYELLSFEKENTSCDPMID